MKVPVVATLATDEPFIVPSSPEATTATLAGPPGLPPASASASSLKNFAPPLFPRKAPKIMNTMTKVAETPSARPKMPSEVRYMCCIILFREYPRIWNMPGT